MTEKDRAMIADAALRLKPLLDGARTAALATHVTPDGDGIGAEICLLGHLRTLGIDARVINTEPLPAKYRFLDPEGAVEVFDASKHDPFLRGADLIFMLDNSATTRMGPLEPAIRASRAVTICIDHHNLVEPFWKVNIVDPESCATGEQVTRCGAETEDTSEVVNDLLSIDGVRVGVLFKEMEGGRTKLSFRSKGDLDVNRLASRFGGGGHTNAAGAIVEGGLEETIRRVLPSCRELLKQLA